MTDRFDQTFLRVARDISLLSRCVSFQVGAVLVKDHRIVSMGYNGTIAKTLNCNEMFPDYDPCKDRQRHHDWSLEFEIHAERNCIAFAAKSGIMTDGSTMYLTLRPCHSCLLLCIQAGIKRIVFLQEYDKSPITFQTEEILQKTGVKLEHQEIS